tara:strand:- start:326 stop:1501 length:1176 start_codon:yes stop_codon:yes gene_type:complete
MANLNLVFAKDRLAPEAISGSGVNQNTLEDKLGFRFSSEQLPDAYRFSRLGGWNVSLRSSAVRIVTFKLIGTGLAAFAMSASARTGAYTSYSCALCASVNFIAAVHYVLIWMVRAQHLPPGFSAWRAIVGRVPEPPEEQSLLSVFQKLAYEDQLKHDKIVVFAQENTIDGLRYSDWACTLVLMVLDLGHLRDWMLDVERESAGTMPIAKEWIAFMQPFMVLFGSIYRFYFNELRGSVDKKTGNPQKPGVATILGGSVCFCVSVGLFVATVYGLLGDALEPSKFTATINNRDAGLETDAWLLRVFVWVWVGYPVVAIIQRLMLIGVRPDEYTANASLFKDLAYGVLDVTSKAGMAIYFATKASWLNADLEFAALCGGSAIGCRAEDIIPLSG